MLPPFVDAGWLHARMGELAVADVRWYTDDRSPAAAYASGHLPGAVFVDLDASLADRPSPGGGRHPLPSPEHFAVAMSALGIGDDDRVVAYDDAGGVIAARLVWMLRVTGHDAALLDGGLAAWDGPLEHAPSARTPAVFTPRAWPAERLASATDAADRSHVVLDARSAARFAGAPDPLDPRPGHVPGARSLPCRENLGADGRLLGREELRGRLEAAGVRPGATVVSYCGSGITACHNLLVLEHAGFDPGRLYPGSWSQWAADPRLPVALGSAPG